MIWLWLSAALGAGTAQLSGLTVSRNTLLHVDILDPATEQLVWHGAQPLLVFDPAGVFLGQLLDGQSLTPALPGTYTLSLSGDEASFDVEVVNAGGGRVWSDRWHLVAPTFTEVDALNTTLFARVRDTSVDTVMMAELGGVAGNLFSLSATYRGVAAAHGRSQVEAGQALEPRYPLYLEPPEASTYTIVTPEILSHGYTVAPEDCDNIGVEGTFDFLGTAAGTWHVLCDLNNDTLRDPTDPADLHLLGEANLGFNLIVWDGRDASGGLVPAGSYTCEILLAVGELHLVAEDVETAFPGLRLFQHSPSQPGTSLPMWWSDTALTGTPYDLPDGQSDLIRSGVTGLPSGAEADAPQPNTNARSWGAFQQDGKGDQALLDTWTWADSASSGTFQIQVTEPGDADSDGLPDLLELCELCTDGANPDTDGDGLLDGVELELHTDGCDPDTDADSVSDFDEVPDPAQPRDTDGDGLIDPLDPDDDDDHVPTLDESPDGDGDPLNDDTDADGVPNYLDVDDDGDGLLTFPAEDVNADGDPQNDDTDTDGVPNYLDPDLFPHTGTPTDTGLPPHTGGPTDTGLIGTGLASTGDTGFPPWTRPTGGTGVPSDTGLGPSVDDPQVLFTQWYEGGCGCASGGAGGWWIGWLMALWVRRRRPAR